ncbi:hydroxypyruvate isomerase family protein [Rhodoflexus caldus]|uniref:hydroxypyruvate isomerase family protein n=1 Tax=Rhodoflexus caldus TaxID=2891236 RepID=UPI00202A03D0|nr:TIM barrel protein [Rhodoflexus caldus]
MTHRRNALKLMVAGAVALSADALANRMEKTEAVLGSRLSGQIRHSVSRWCYSDLSLDELCIAAKRFGIESVELLNIEELPLLKKHELTCGMVSAIRDGFGIPKGWNDPRNHEGLMKLYADLLIPETAKAGMTNLICFSGNRNGMSDEQGLKNCAAGLKKLIPLAEKYKVTLVMELLNSKIDHKDYMCDHTAWGVELCQMVGSENFKLLYDIYHMQIMEGDVIRTIRENHQYIAHYHTAGVPGRNEIDDTQELNYPAIMRAIVETGYKGLVGQEFIPKNQDKLVSLEKAIKICTV